MAQANHSIFQHTPLTIAQHIAMATMTRAMQLARGVVKDQLKRQKIRLADVDTKDITSWALVYLDDHPEVIAEARSCVEGWFARGVFGKRAQRAFCATLKTSVQSRKARKSATSAVQISGAK
jgi:hypothetical protein